MSLINDMLRDLEKRQAPDRTQQAPAQNYGALTQRDEPRSNRLVIIFLVLTVLTLIGLVLGWWYLQTYQTPTSGNGTMQDSQAHYQNVEAVPSAENKQHNAERQIKRAEVTKKLPDNKPSVSTTAKEKALIVNPRNEPANAKRDALAISSARTASARTESAKDGAAISQTPASQKPQSATPTQKVAEKTVAKKALIKSEPANVKAAPAKIASSVKKPEPEVERMTASTSPIRPVQSKPKNSLVGASTITKTNVISPEQQDQNMADLGSGMLQRGDKKAARDTLYGFIRTHSVTEQSRIVLIRDLMQSGEVAEAGNVLASSDVRSNSYLRRLKAHWLALNGQPDQAVVLLNSDLPSVDEDTDYHVLLAALYQQQGYNREAAAKYAELLDFNQDIADWWVGMGISLDKSGQYDAAKRAYEQALKMSGLRVELADFARQRVATLGG